MPDEDLQPTRRVKIDMAALAEALDEAFAEAQQYLDLETGQVVVVTDEISRLRDELYAEAGGAEGDDDSAFAAALEQRRLPGWMKEAVREADLVEEGFGTRFLRVPPREPRDGYRDLEAFVATVADGRLQRRLNGAIIGRGAFRRFRAVLDDHPDEQERWYAFRNERLRERALRWLRDEDIEPLFA